jgi:hypothetical protein
MYAVMASVAGVSTPAALSLSNTATQATTITATSGTPQTTPILTPFASPLVATVKDGTGNPVSGAIVWFSAPLQAYVTFSSGPDSSTYLFAATTNGAGIATSGTLVANKLAASYAVQAVIPGQPAYTTFSMTNIPGPPATITAYIFPPPPEENAVVGTMFAYPISATVTDAGGNLLNGVPVTFSAPDAGPSAAFSGSGTFTTVTAGNGSAATPRFTANTTAGSYNLLVSAPGVATPASFALTNVDYTLQMHTPGVVQITAGTPAPIRLDMATIPANTAMPTTASLTCAVPGSLFNAFCSFSSPGGLLAGRATEAITLTISTKGGATSSLRPINKLDAARRLASPSARLPLTYLPPLFAIAFGILAYSRNEHLPLRRVPARTMLLVVVMAGGLLSCGSGGGSSSSSNVPVSIPSPDTPTPRGPSTVTVTSTVPTNNGQPGGVSKSITININVN